MTDRLHWKNFFSVQRPIQCRRWVGRSDHYAHDHDFFELVAITAGHGRHRSADGEIAIGAGDLILLTPGVWHEYVGCAALSGFDCCFGKDMLYREFSWITDDPVLGRLMLRSAGTRYHRRPVVAHIERPQLARIKTLLAAIADPPDEAVGGQQMGKPLVQAPRENETGRLELFGSVLVALGYFADAIRPELGKKTPTASRSHTTLTSRAQALFAEDLTRAWTLDEIADALGTSTSFLARAFRSVVGRSPLATFMRMRMEHAAMLLLRSQLPVSEIAARVGVFDANYFARRFRVELGLTPTVYRQQFAEES